MDMDNAAAFLAGGILYILGLVAIIIGIVVINNILHKYWKPVKFFTFPELQPHRFATEEELKNAKPTEERNESSQTKQK